MNKPEDKNNKSGGWKILIASISLTSFIGLVNLFSGKDASAAASSEIDALVNAPLPTLVPAASSTIDAAPPALREVSGQAPAPTPTPAPNPVIERITVGGGGSSSGRPATTTSSSR